MPEQITEHLDFAPALPQNSGRAIEQLLEKRFCLHHFGLAGNMASEQYIENNVIRNRAAIGFADSPYIRRCRAGLGFGAADLVLLPSHGPHRIVIIEAKLGHSQDAAAKVVGRLLMYYAGAQQFGANGLRLLREFASSNERRARNQSPKTLKMLSGGLSPREEAWHELQKGRKLRPDQIKLFIALNGEPSGSLKSSLKILASQHALVIDVISVIRVNQLEVWSPA